MREEAKKKISALVERFRNNIDVYKTGAYNETQVRREFIDPFFKALGWDIENESGWAEQYKEVVHEDSVKVGVSLKAPDYSFRIGGQRKFFLEAKKPSVSIKDDISPAFQLRRYAWSAKLPLSILTDFEELAVYDCRIRPDQKDKVSTGRTNYYTFEDYLEKFDEIYGTFSKEAVLKGSFDRYIETSKGKRGTAEVDSDFLKEIESWRDSLARNLALRNPRLTVDELNFAVQHTIDRIIFLRICEDRGIEDYGRLQGLLNGVNVYGRLMELFYKADAKYNSGLFDFKADNLSHILSIDDKALKAIIESLYPPESPYEFSVIGADILGNVYEQFLGKVIRLTSGHQAKVEEKPEVKKAGGVFYTPQYIVEYIVKNTVGRTLEGKTPRQAEKLRMLDPACGSGSFLIGAYQHLLDWHLEWYTSNDPERHAKGKTPAVYRSRAGWKLTTAEKKKILLNNIYGVDIDRQAVEVTKLSLLLKVLEDENHETIGKNLVLYQERVLPNLENNIKCGNSLIGPDFDSQMGFGFDDPEARRVNVFDWNDEKRGFGRIMKDGGFDCVIGNPPYVRQEMLGPFKPYLQTHFKTYNGVADLYVYFIEKGVGLLKENGVFSYIVANKWMRANYGEPLRRWMKAQAIEEIVDFGDLPVFQTATTYPCIIRIRKGGAKDLFTVTNVKTLDFKSLLEYVEAERSELSRSALDDGGWSLAGAEEAGLLSKIRSKGVTLGEYVKGKIYRGILTGFDEAFVIDANTRKKLINEDVKNKELIRPFLAGRDVKRYQTPETNKFLIFTRRGIDIKKYPAIEDYLSQFKERLTPKPKGWNGKDWKGRKPGSYKWYEIQDSVDYYQELEKPKIAYLKFQVKPAFTFDNEGYYCNSAVWVVPKDDKYLLGILNSKLGWFLISKYCTQIQNGYQLIFKYLRNIPIHLIDSNNKHEKSLHDKIVSLVERMLELNKELKSARTPHDRELIERQINATDARIDAIVYELYGLTPEEIKVVEGA